MIQTNPLTGEYLRSNQDTLTAPHFMNIRLDHVSVASNSSKGKPSRMSDSGDVLFDKSRHPGWFQIRLK